MKISCFGIGYVGLTFSAHLADFGHKVICVDIDSKKVKLVNEGESPIKQRELNSLVRRAWEEGRLSATIDPIDAVKKTDISLISVPTPVDKDGRADLSSVFNVFQKIGEGIRHKNEYHLVVLRSTSPPGTTRKGLNLIRRVSGKDLGSDFGGCMNPEFLREWALIEDFRNPPFVIIGQYDKKSGDLAEPLYQDINAKLVRTELEVAEMVKYACNAFHALKISFTNEIGRVCKQMGIDARKVMKVFVKDTKLNLSSSYLKPGFAFGGSCLPKDVRAIARIGREVGAKTRLLDSILTSNSIHIECVVDRIEKIKAERVGIIGLAYHENTDDLRGSQIIELIRRLIERGFKVSVYDDHVKLSKLIDSNKRYVESLPFNLAELLTSSMEELVESTDVLVIAHKRPDLKSFINKLPSNKYCIDLVGLYDSGQKPQNYEGICW